MTIGEKLRAAVSADEALSSAVLQAAHERPKTGDGYLSEFEQDCLDWGLVYGMAFALCREASTPWEAPETVAKRAFAEAWSVWSHWSGGSFHERVTDEKVNDVVSLYQSTGGLPKGYEPFEAALVALSNAAGIKAP